MKFIAPQIKIENSPKRRSTWSPKRSTKYKICDQQVRTYKLDYESIFSTHDSAYLDKVENDLHLQALLIQNTSKCGTISPQKERNFMNRRILEDFIQCPKYDNG